MMNFKENGCASFVVISIIYILASAFGIMVYRFLPFDMWLSLLIADMAATAITFVFSVILGNASVYDPYWSVQPIVILIALAALYGVSLSSVLLIITVSLWGVRLTANWAYTFSDLTHQDWRYTMLRERTGIFYPIINFVGIHSVPTLVVYAATLPAAYVIIEHGEVNVWFVLSLILSLLAATLQCISDIEMHSFRKRGVGGFIRSGLWKYSRHPNYLGEIMMWWGIALASMASLGFRWYLPIGAMLNTALFLFVSIPMADARQSRKEGFEEYKKSTRMLIPIKK